jgi:carbonic anhydrase/acetyltransferase-like protein (isoleucine patch superfamily)
MWLLSVVVVSAAHAQASNKAAAEALFEEGRRLMGASQFAEACAKFEGSQALEPAVGTALNLADCYEKSGRSASAWAQFRETAAAAHKAGSPERERIARERADALAPRLSYLTVITRPGHAVVVTRDAVPLDAAEVGSAIPVDAGAHVIAATAPNKRPWSTTVQVGATADRVSVSIPLLEDESKSELPVPIAVEPEPAAAPATAAARSDAAEPGSTQRVFAIVAAAVGVAGLATGTVFGIKASSTWNEAKAGCHPYPHCSAAAHEQSLDAQRSGTISTVAFIAGGVGVAAGALLWFTAPRREAASQVSLDVGPGCVVMRGRF